MNSPDEWKSFAFSSMLFLFGVGIAYLCVWGYDAAVDRLFRTIEFGCNDFSHKLDISTPTED